MTGKPAATLVHLGPGLGNGLANLHNARRANSPVISIVGEHASELVTEFVLAKTHKLGLNKILQTVHIYPTRSEINRMVAGKWRRRQISPRTLNLLKKFQRWRIDS